MKQSRLLLTLAGAVIVVILVTGATVWMSRGAQHATDAAVEQISFFYLDELAGRRSQVISRFFDSQEEEMKRAVSLMTPEVLSSQESLRAYIGSVEDLLGLSRFAVVDEDNTVYTEHSTYMGGSRYTFLSGEESGTRSITTTSTYGGTKEICLAIPLRDQYLMGKRLKTCFIEIQMSDIVSMLAFNAEESGTHFSLYYENGANLTGLDFGPFGVNRNLLREMAEILTEEEARSLRSDFENSAAGAAEFIQAGSDQMFYYSPIPETGWMITVLINKNLIHDQVDGIQRETMTRSTIQIIVTCVSLLAFFFMFVMMERQESRKKIEAQRKLATRDAQTGVGNKYAFAQKEAAVDADIRKGSAEPFAILVCDLNGLKHVNDTQGHTAGDDYIREASRLICGLYDHSPVYRIGGDEFAVFLRGSDYERREELMETLTRTVEENAENGRVVVAAGMADFEPEDERLHDVFNRADGRMYARKRQLKQRTGL